jgi:hypothetical protein
MAAGLAASAGRVALGKLVPSTSALFVCDVQERFRPLIAGYPTVIDTARRMVRANVQVGKSLCWCRAAVNHHTIAPHRSEALMRWASRWW